MHKQRILSVTEAGKKLLKGDVSAMELVASCLERISKHDNWVKAWVEVYEDQAIANARKCDEVLKRGDRVPPLHGIPIGVKDIIDVEGMWTRAGSEAYEAKIAPSDAEAVSRLRRAGAIILGKTVTTAFANNDPAATRNPLNPEHTPGGSSSGSGAAVADQMCLAALGTQTGGSILRPAAYTGIVGLKATYASISVEGVIPVSFTLDHLGPLVASVADAKLFFEILHQKNPERYAYMPAMERTHEYFQPINRPVRLGFFKNFTEKESSADTYGHIKAVCQEFKNAGASITDLDFTELFAQAAQAHRIIMDAELAEYHWSNYNKNNSKYPANIRKRIEKGRTISAHAYLTALKVRITCQKRLLNEFSFLDAAILPTAPSSAPKGIESNGSPIFCVPWSMFGFPTITIPSGLSAEGLPYGIQIVAKPYDEFKLFNVAAWCEDKLAFQGKIH